MLPLQGAWVQFLVGELRSLMPRGTAKKKRQSHCADSVFQFGAYLSKLVFFSIVSSVCFCRDRSLFWFFRQRRRILRLEFIYFNSRFCFRQEDIPSPLAPGSALFPLQAQQ